MHVKNSPNVETLKGIKLKGDSGYDVWKEKYIDCAVKMLKTYFDTIKKRVPVKWVNWRVCTHTKHTHATHNPAHTYTAYTKHTLHAHNSLLKHLWKGGVSVCNHFLAKCNYTQLLYTEK